MYTCVPHFTDVVIVKVSPLKLNKGLQGQKAIGSNFLYAAELLGITLSDFKTLCIPGVIFPAMS